MKGAVLVDIEGTTGPVSFVREVLFPFARAELPAFVRERGSDPTVRRHLQAAAREAGQAHDDDRALVALLQGWIDEDRKSVPLKKLQGLIWASGYANGSFRAPLYPDAEQALARWHASHCPVYVYSSGSTDAQRLFFAHTTSGDLRRLLAGHFDGEIGSKRAAESYLRIAAAVRLGPRSIHYFSDSVDELDAARAAGLATTLVDRRQDYPQPRDGEAARGHDRVVELAGETEGPL